MSGQQDFVDALFATDNACPDGLTTWNGSDPGRRFAVYRNNVMVSLDRRAGGYFSGYPGAGGRGILPGHGPAIRARPPAAFRASWPTTARNSRRSSLAFPPAAPVLIWPMWRASNAAGAGLSRGRTRRVLGGDEINATLAAPLADESESALPGLRFVLHPSVAVLPSQFAVVALWGAHQGLLDIAAVDPAIPQTALVVRIGLDVNVVGIDARDRPFHRPTAARGNVGSSRNERFRKCRI